MDAGDRDMDRIFDGLLWNRATLNQFVREMA